MLLYVCQLDFPGHLHVMGSDGYCHIGRTQCYAASHPPQLLHCHKTEKVSDSSDEVQRSENKVDE